MGYNKVQRRNGGGTMNYLEFISEYSEVILIGVGGLSLLLLILVIILLCKQSKLNKKYKKFMAGENGRTLEETIFKRFTEMDELKNDSKKMNAELVNIKENLQSTFQKIGVVKYNAFKEMGGKLSFVLALLDSNNNGIILNSVHSSREGCYIYLKEIIKGESFLELSSDEKLALQRAMDSTNYME